MRLGALSSLTTYLLDTNHISQVLGGQDPGAIGRIWTTDQSDLRLCSIVVGELAFMVENSEQRDANRRLLDSLLWSCPGSVDSSALRISSCLGAQRQGCAFVV
jgi:predicted nucleic acid-binding protein